jgi:putative ABC transport system permease protein
VVRTASGGSAGVGEVVVVITVDKKGTTGVSNVTVRGVPPSVYEFRPEARIVQGRKAQPHTDEVVIGKAVNGRFEGVELGKTFELKKNRPVTVVGVFEADGSSFESEVWADIDTARTAFGRQGLVSAVRARLTDASKFDAFKNEVESDKKLGLAVEREDKYYEKQSQGMATFMGALGITIAIFFSFGAMIGAAITMYGQVANRAKEVGTLRALGFSRFSILSSFLLESIMLAIAGGVLGALLSLLMGFVKFSTINFVSWSEIVFRFEPTPGIILGSLIFAGIMGVLGGFLPALRASAVSPIQAMRN